MTKTLVAIRHVAFEDLGGFHQPLSEAGYSIRYADMGLDRIATCGDPDLLVVLGGPIGAYEEQRYPWLQEEIAYLAARLRAQKPTLGICLGAQLMARALGARVYPGPAKEIGWKPLRISETGLLSPLSGHPVLHWHGDTFDLPKGAIGLASTDVCLNQAFCLDRYGLACQFHPEAQAFGFERWLIGHACEIAATPGISVEGLRSDTDRYAAAALVQSQQILRNWLSQLP